MARKAGEGAIAELRRATAIRRVVIRATAHTDVSVRAAGSSRQSRARRSREKQTCYAGDQSVNHERDHCSLEDEAFLILQA